MSLEERFAEVPGPPRQCKTCIWYTQLDVKDKAFFDDKSTNDRFGDKKKLWKACCANGLTASYTSFRDHINDLHAARNGTR